MVRAGRLFRGRWLGEASVLGVPFHTAKMAALLGRSLKNRSDWGWRVALLWGFRYFNRPHAPVPHPLPPLRAVRGSQYDFRDAIP
jgi:hypothetical protein